MTSKAFKVSKKEAELNELFWKRQKFHFKELNKVGNSYCLRVGNQAIWFNDKSLKEVKK